MTNEIKGGGQSQVFEYEKLDGSTAEFLRKKETNIRQTGDKINEGLTEWGIDLKEARDRLAGNNQYNGLFGKWCEHVGFNIRQAQRLINRADLVATLSRDQAEIVEELPTTLSYAVSAPSAESTPAKAQAKAEVLAGDISTGKAYKDRIAELKAQAEAERKERERLEAENEELANRPPKVETRTEYVEVDNTPHDYDEVKQRLEEYGEKFGDLSNYDDKVTATHRQDMIVAVMSFSQGVREFIKRYEYMKQYKNVIDNLDDGSKQQYDEAVNALKGMAQTFEYSNKNNEVIDADYSEII